MRLVALLAVTTALLTACTAAAPPLPPFTLTNQSGHVVSAGDLRGRATVVNFIFTTCGDVCPLVTTQLVRVQARLRSEGLGDRVGFVSITVDPAVDTPPALERYAAAYGADLTTWHFLTGSASDIERVTRDVGLLTGTTGRIGHTNLLLFVDARGRIAGRETSVELDPERVLPKIRRLLG